MLTSFVIIMIGSGLILGQYNVAVRLKEHGCNNLIDLPKNTLLAFLIGLFMFTGLYIFMIHTLPFGVLELILNIEDNFDRKISWKHCVMAPFVSIAMFTPMAILAALFS